MEIKDLLEKDKKKVQNLLFLKRLLSKIININNNDNKNSLMKNINYNDKKKKIRNPGIDLVRILAMYAIIIHHILVFPRIIYQYNQYKELFLIKISCFWHVSGFALISGYIGYKTNKYSNLLYLWICTSFYALNITYFFTKRLQFKDFFPVYYHKYWYFTKYFGMYLFLPLINKGIISLTNIELRIVDISLIMAFVVFKDIINPNEDIYLMNEGKSVIWFIIYYITGAYFRISKKEYNGIKIIFLIIICILIFYFSTFFCFYFSNYSLNNLKGYFKNEAIKRLKNLFSLRISSFPMILQSTSITLLLTHIKYNKYLAKIITFSGPLIFGVYLIHMHPTILYIITGKLFLKQPYNLSLFTVIKYVLIKGLQIFGICLFVDYLRHILFTFLRIRKICIFFENIVYKIF